MTTERPSPQPRETAEPADNSVPLGFDLGLPVVDVKKSDGRIEDIVEWVTCEAGLFEAKLARDNRDVGLPETSTSLGRLAVRIASVVYRVAAHRYGL